MLGHREKIRERKLKWRCRNGRVIPIDAMDTEHIKNCIVMLRRNGLCTIEEFDVALASSASLQGDMASYYGEQTVAEMKPSKKLSAFIQELESRGEKI